ncbi:cupin domain-containing protein [Hymenobacter volaticus]|uniref:Cupin domain-containing protein n=1 Tax=Hymenobacter volaticus TaxID=2932254 RepID=A0ABY4GFR9_9BACT|nr:cupin domain-containing protein [Hymenobacter volaticus]UOQ69334.1 cupin domain-containing protein [Hymenobacter volaticus]
MLKEPLHELRYIVASHPYFLAYQKDPLTPGSRLCRRHLCLSRPHATRSRISPSAGVTVLWGALLLGGSSLARAQTPRPGTSVGRPEAPLVHRAGEPAALAYDFGHARFLVDSAATRGAWSLVEITEQPGYQTPWHRHGTWDESFYVLAGTLTAKVRDTVYTLPAGSYLLIPRGTPHRQANRGTVPVTLLLTLHPSGFERHLKDRVELFKTSPPGSPSFPAKMAALRQKNAQYIEILGTWEMPKH